jgi:hypothetical protein
LIRQTIKISILFLSLFVVCFSLSAGSIKFQTEIEDKLDSLLITGDFESANDLLNKSDLLDTKQGFLKVLNNIKEIDTLPINPNYVKKLFEKYKSTGARFSTENAGKKSNIAYSKFLEFADRDTKQAMKYHIIAAYFKEKYIQNLIENAEAKIQEAKVLYEDKKITEAINIMKSIKLLPENNLKLKEVKHTFDTLNAKVMKSKYEEDLYKHFWEQAEKADYTFKLGIGVIFGSNYPLQHEILGRDPGFNLNKSGISIPACLSFNQRFSLGLDLNFTYHSYSSGTLDTSPYFFSFDSYSSSIQTYLQFFLREQTGLRPHIDFGLGYLYVTSEAFTAYHRPLGDPGEFTRSTFYPARTFNTLQILTEMGVEYISSNTTNFSIGSKLSVHYNTRNTTALDQFNISLNVNIGLVL